MTMNILKTGIAVGLACGGLSAFSADLTVARGETLELAASETYETVTVSGTLNIPEGVTLTRGLWRCDPRDGRWERLHGDALACAVTADPLDPTRIVLTTADNPYHDFAGGHGVFVSADDGATWTPANEGLHVRRLTCVAFDPFDGETLVAGTTGGGFVRTRWTRTPTAD